ncbi:MAG: hypothetical protein ONB16_00355 [candidate division KSB1 bacterium]|nr:hypothetical protein [candidate division KSB1 bacterium]MDZ7317687.1 hypothetical protein [candidate division KSB1 bacterium]MDZ7340162.1 hypothetical protein [candidate division KSB1 bacterium]
MQRKIYILIICIFLYFSCERNSNPISYNDNVFITKIDIEGMMKKHLPDFRIVRKRARWKEGREFVFVNDKHNIFIRAGIHSSKAKVQEIAEEYNNSCWIRPIEDTNKIWGIGDKCWWMPDIDSPDTVQYQFIRNNIFIIVNSHNYPDILSLTKSIDQDILNDADYIKLGYSLSLPVIKSITASKKELKEGETTKITIQASDPYNEPLEYVFNFGLYHVESDPKNVFTFEASRDYVPAPFFGSHILKFIVVNESNVVSEVAEFEITIFQ